MSYRRKPPVVLAVRDLHEEIRAGYGASLFAVRTLDGVSLTVRAGELVVLRGGVACGAASLVAHLTGMRVLRSGVRIAARGVRIRRGCISEEALDALVAGWSTAPVAADGASTPAPRVVHVFRVRPSSSLSATRPSVVVRDGREQWRAWAATLRAREGSVIAHVPITPRFPPRASPGRYDRPPKTQKPPVVHEATTGDHDGYDAYWDSSGGVRVMTLAAGRIVSVDPVTRPW